MEFLSAMIPYLNIGFFAAIAARLTGANLSALVLCSILYLGATPIQTIGMMLTYMVFVQLTYHTQNSRLTYNTLRIFKGWRILIPVLFIVVTIISNPFFAMASFVGFFLMEVLAMLYYEQPKNDRLSIASWIMYVVIGTLLAVIGLFLIRLIPESIYYLVAGGVILAVCALAYYLGKNRSALSGIWDAVIYFGYFLLGMFGLELTNWFRDLERTKSTALTRHIWMISVPIIFFTFVASNVMYATISLSGLIIALAATVAMRFFGYYEVSGKGNFSILAIGMTALFVVSLFLVQPEPTGVTDLIYISLPDFTLPWSE